MGMKNNKYNQLLENSKSLKENLLVSIKEIMVEKHLSYEKLGKILGVCRQATYQNLNNPNVTAEYLVQTLDTLVNEFYF